MRLPHIVVLGAGYGGLRVVRELVHRLQETEARVTLIDQHSYHTLVTNLHEPAGGTRPPQSVQIPLQELVWFSAENVQWHQGRVTGIDRTEQQILLQDQEPLSYDYLVVGLGATPETFGIPGLLEHAFFIWDVAGVSNLCNHVEERFRGYKEDLDPTRLTIVVGGAGFTGIEYLGELTDHIPVLCKRYDVPRELVRVISVEAAPGALPGFAPDLVTYAVDYLTKQGVEFRFGTAVASCSPEGVVFRDGTEVKAGTVVWTGGVRGLPLLAEATFAVERGRVPVDAYLRPEGSENLFIVGDCSLVARPDQARAFYPPTAQLAMQQGANAARNIIALIRSELPVPFSYAPQGTIASLGSSNAMGYLGSVSVRGKVATLFKRLAFYRWLYLAGGLRIVWRYGLQADMRGNRTAASGADYRA